MNKTLKEIAKEKGKTLLIEQVLISINKENIEMFDKDLLIESEGKQLACKGILKNVPVTKFIENLNGRIYSKKLWENVKDKKVFEGSLCLADHSENEGSVKDIAGVWRNFKVNEETGNADIYCVGNNGQLMLEVANASGKVGYSTVGYGEFLSESKNTVNPDTFEYCRCDWVINPSQQVFGTKENIESIEENVQKSVILDKKVTNKLDNTNNIIEMKEQENNKTTEVLRMDKFTELNHRNQIKEAIRKAKHNENLTEAIDVLNSIETEEEDLKTSVGTEIFNLQEKLNTQKETAIQELDEKTKALNDLQEKYNIAVKVVDEMKVLAERSQKIYEMLEIKDEDDLDEMKEYMEKSKDEYETAVTNVKVMQEDIDTISNMFLEENFTNLEVETVQDIKDLVEDTIKRDEDITFLKNSLTEAENHIDECTAKLKEYGFEFEEADDKEDDKEDKDDDEDKKDKDKSKDKDMKDDDKDDDDEDMKKDKKEKKESSDVKIFIDREIAKNSVLKDIKEELEKSKTLKEAIEKIDTFSTNNEDELIKFDEDSKTKNDSKINVYKFKRN